ncbi:MAG TPA: multiheme c-type cytochrome [candidate division Zixibacteria bacterium]|nr:multiheme c-type cytochrome [candidate division Zixibacteria bacterium]
MRKVSVSALILVSFMMLAFLAYAQETAEKKAFEYIGPAKCKMCHKDVHAAWETTAHAKAFASLSAEEQKKAECNVCHMTGANAKGEAIENVTCESCHGPGSAYSKPTIMTKKWSEDPATYKAKAIEAGLIYPDSALCATKCHKKEGNPNFKPFSWDKMSKLVHPVAATPAEEKK